MDETLLDSIIADLPPLLTRREAAAVLRCRDAHISDLVRSGDLPGFQRARRQGSKLLIPRDALRAYIQRHAL